MNPCKSNLWFLLLFKLAAGLKMRNLLISHKLSASRGLSDKTDYNRRLCGNCNLNINEGEDGGVGNICI